MDALHFSQGANSLVLTRKAVGWLIDNTEVSVFDPVSFTGYQRKIDEKHCEKIVEYLMKNEAFLPNAIICACDNAYRDDLRLRIVDGQHRVEAFRILKKNNSERFEEISSIEIPVVVLVNVGIDTEIQTFITINKTSKKVDTSLAYVLKNRLSNSGDLTMSRAEYISVEVAKKLNDEDEMEMWKNMILYEGSIRNSNCLISLNAFVKATRVLINTLNSVGFINLSSFRDIQTIEATTLKVQNLIVLIWDAVYQRWPDLVDRSLEEKRVIQGAIGYTAIIRMLVKHIKDTHPADLCYDIRNTILSINVPSKEWTKEGRFSRYSSESGYKFVSDELMRSISDRVLF